MESGPLEARDEIPLLNLQRYLSCLSPGSWEWESALVPHRSRPALRGLQSQRYDRDSIMVTTNLPFDEWTEVFGSERLNGALLDRLTHHVHILEVNGNRCRLRHSRQAHSHSCAQTDVPSEGAMEGDSESPAQGDVASSNRAGIGNPQSHHKEIHGCRRPSNATNPGGCCCHAVI